MGAHMVLLANAKGGLSPYHITSLSVDIEVFSPLLLCPSRLFLQRRPPSNHRSRAEHAETYVPQKPKAGTTHILRRDAKETQRHDSENNIVKR